MTLPVDGSMIAARGFGHALRIVQDIFQCIGGTRVQVHHADTDVGLNVDRVAVGAGDPQRAAGVGRDAQAQRAQSSRRMDGFHERDEAAVVVPSHWVDDAQLALDARGEHDEHLIDAGGAGAAAP
jgi:hypothetical protein